MQARIDNVSAVDLDGAWDKRHPSEGKLCPAARTPTNMAPVGVAPGRILPADRLHGIGVKAEISTASGAKLDQIENSRPLRNSGGFCFLNA
jgi:hypothetical protein